MRKFLLSLMAVITAIGCVRAEEVTFDVGSLNSSSGDLIGTQKINGVIEMSFGREDETLSGLQDPKYKNSSYVYCELQTYYTSNTINRNTVTIKSLGTDKLKKIVFKPGDNYGSGFTWGSLKATEGQVESNSNHEYTWTGDAQSVTFAVDVIGTSTSTHKVRFRYVEFTYGSGDVELVSNPTFATEGDEYGKTLTLDCETEGAKIYYTTDGSTPDASKTEYTAPIVVDKNMTVKAVAMKDGATASAEVEQSYTIKARKPEFSIAGGTYNDKKELTLSCATEGVTIYYNKNTFVPTEKSTKYTAGEVIEIDESMTITAKAFREDLVESDTAQVKYEVKLDVATPTISVGSGTYTEAQSVELKCETEGAKIYYTTDGSNADASKTEYTGAISIDKDVTIKAIAVKYGNKSQQATATYKFATKCESISSASAMEDGARIKFGIDLFVVWEEINAMDGNTYLYVTDGEEVYPLRFKNVTTFATYTNGVRLKAGIECEKDGYYFDSDEKTVEGENIIEQEHATEPKERNISSLTEADVNKYVLLRSCYLNDDAADDDKVVTDLAGNTIRYDHLMRHSNSTSYPLVIEDTESCYDVIGFIGTIESYTPKKEAAGIKRKAANTTVMIHPVEIIKDTTTGVDGENGNRQVSVVANEGTITVAGAADQIAVYTASGVCISKNERTVTCGAGLYVVTVDGLVKKVVVK